LYQFSNGAVWQAETPVKMLAIVIMRLGCVMRVYVLLFNAGTDNEGIHTLRIGDRNVILMFEAEDDATRYSIMLEAQDFASPTVEAIDSEEVEEFCSDSGFEFKLVPEGMLEIPPEHNVDETDWETGSSDGDRKPDQARSPEEEASEFADDELDAIRRRLEGLL
jgi:hypothetical protein